METNATGRRFSPATWIPLLLIIVGIFVWGVQYKLSLYDAPGSPSRSIPQAKLLSPNERVGSVRADAQLRPQLLPSLPPNFQSFLAASVYLLLLSIQLVRAKLVDSRDLRHTNGSICTFFTFRPPPSFTLA